MSMLADQEVRTLPDLEEMKKLPIVGRKPSNEKEEAFLREVCEFEFINLKEPGVLHKFTYGSTKNHKNFTFFHGEKYKLPRFIARHVESCATPIYNWAPDGTGKLIKKYVGPDPRFQMRQVFSAS